MPSNNLSQGLQSFNLPTGSYGYTATDLNTLGATEYTLATIVCDVSGSVGGYADKMEAAIQQIVEACKYSPRADNLMIRLLTFNERLNEVHGFKLLSACQVSDYKNILHCAGGTALFSSTENAIRATADYAKQLHDSDYTVNAIAFIITDGDDNCGGGTVRAVKTSLTNAMRGESLESISTVLIGVALDAGTAALLNTFQTDAGLTQYVQVGDANAKNLAKLAQFVSKSISAQSQALGTGGASQPLTF